MRLRRRARSCIERPSVSSVATANTSADCDRPQAAVLFTIKTAQPLELVNDTRISPRHLADHSLTKIFQADPASIAKIDARPAGSCGRISI